MAKITLDFLHAIKKIDTDVRQILTTLRLIGKDVQTIKEDRSAERNNDVTAGDENGSVALNSTKKKTKSYDKKQYALDKLRYRLEKQSLRIGKWTLAALALYTGFTGYQSCQNKKSAEAATNAATTASKSLTNSQNAFILNERPYIVVSEKARIEFLKPPAPNQQIRANVTLENIGKTPAIYITGQFRLMKYRGQPKTPEGNGKNAIFWQKVFEELNQKEAAVRKEVLEKSVERDVAPSVTFWSTSSDDLRLSAPEIADMRKGLFGILYVGVITYTDNFKGEYKTEFCYAHLGPDVRVWQICSNNNTIK